MEADDTAAREADAEPAALTSLGAPTPGVVDNQGERQWGWMNRCHNNIETVAQDFQGAICIMCMNKYTPWLGASGDAVVPPGCF